MPDLTELALYIVRQASRTLQFLAAENQSLVIPPGVSSHQMSAAVTLPADIDVHAIGAHMHLLGRTVDVQARLPDGTSRCLLQIADWDPAWQGMYAYREPVRLPAGTRIEALATYDNSSANPRNPHNPPREVVWGEEALNEMLSAYLAYTIVDPVGATAP